MKAMKAKKVAMKVMKGQKAMTKGALLGELATATEMKRGDEHTAKGSLQAKHVSLVRTCSEQFLCGNSVWRGRYSKERSTGQKWTCITHSTLVYKFSCGWGESVPQASNYGKDIHGFREGQARSGLHARKPRSGCKNPSNRNEVKSLATTVNLMPQLKFEYTGFLRARWQSSPASAVSIKKKLAEPKLQMVDTQGSEQNWKLHANKWPTKVSYQRDAWACLSLHFIYIYNTWHVIYLNLYPQVVLQFNTI